MILALSVVSIGFLGLPSTASASACVDDVFVIHNPSAGENDYFGFPVESYGDDILVGAPWDDAPFQDSGAAYLYDGATGSLMRSFTNPSPQDFDFFGNALAGVGALVVVGADVEGRVYVFDAGSGELLRSLQPPQGGFRTFGGKVIPVLDHVLVGAIWDVVDGQIAGSAYLFDPRTGEFLHRFVNPTPDFEDRFGHDLATTGSMVIIGAYLDDYGAEQSGVVHVFDVETRALIRTLANPDPGVYDNFGFTIAASGERIIVGAYNDDTMGEDSGTAYLFDALTGNLLLTIHNPEPASFDDFGFDVAFLGPDLVISAPDDDAAGDGTGSVYLINGTSGSVMMRFQKPRADPEDRFGPSIASLGDKLAIGVQGDDAGAFDTGAVYVFSAGCTGSRFSFGSILRPIRLDTVSEFHLGQTISVKFQLLDVAGDITTDARASLEIVPYGQEPMMLGKFRTAGTHYVFNWDTRDLSPLRYTMRLVLEDGLSFAFYVFVE